MRTGRASRLKSWALTVMACRRRHLRRRSRRREPRAGAGRSSPSTSSLIEAHPFGTSGQPSFDDRTTALSNGSRRIFEALRRVAAARARGDGHPPHPRLRPRPVRLRAARRGGAGTERARLRRASTASMGAALWRRLEESAVCGSGAGAACVECSWSTGASSIECDLGPQGTRGRRDEAGDCRRWRAIRVARSRGHRCADLGLRADGARDATFSRSAFTTMSPTSASRRRARWRCCRCPKGGWA